MGSVKLELKPVLNKNQWYALGVVFCAGSWGVEVDKILNLFNNPAKDGYYLDFLYYILMTALWSYAGFRWLMLIKAPKVKPAKIKARPIEELTDEEKSKLIDELIIEVPLKYKLLQELTKEITDKCKHIIGPSEEFWTQAKEDYEDLAEMEKVKDEQFIAWDQFEKGLSNPEEEQAKIKAEMEKVKDEEFITRLEADDRWDSRELGSSEEHVRRVDESIKVQTKSK